MKCVKEESDTLLQSELYFCSHYQYLFLMEVLFLTTITTSQHIFQVCVIFTTCIIFMRLKLCMLYLIIFSLFSVTCILEVTAFFLLVQLWNERFKVFQNEVIQHVQFLKQQHAIALQNFKTKMDTKIPKKPHLSRELINERKVQVLTSLKYSFEIEAIYTIA